MSPKGIKPPSEARANKPQRTRGARAKPERSEREARALHERSVTPKAKPKEGARATEKTSLN
jgi:hypothetical protein